MSIVRVQTVTGAGATVVINSVVAGNLLTYENSYFRNPSTGLGENNPADSQGQTWSAGRADAPAISGGFDMGTSHFYIQNALAGTHTCTPEVNSSHFVTITEWSGMLTSGVLDASVAAQNGSGAGTSQATGTTSTTAQADEIVMIAFAMGATGTGATDVTFTDPVANFTTLQINKNDATSTALMHCSRIISAIGTQTATFNWTTSDPTQWWQASIVTYKGVSAAGDSIGPENIAQSVGRYIGWVK